VAPANGAALTTLIPLFEWSAPADPASYSFLSLELAWDADFSDVWRTYYKSNQYLATDWRLPFNLETGTTYYWRLYYRCGSETGTPSAGRSFTTGSGGELLSAPSLVAPADGSILSGTGVTVQWEAVPGALEYLVARQEAATGYTVFYWTTETEFILTVQSGKLYKWWARAADDYALGYTPPAWQFLVTP
jgi:hypothetical protein